MQSPGHDKGTGEFIPTPWYMQEQIEYLCQILEQIKDSGDLRRRISPQGIDLSIRRRVLAGFQFKGLAEGESPLRPFDFRLGKGASAWISLAASLETTNLFGSNFGELIKPKVQKPNSTCGIATGLPLGYDFLAAPLYVLRSTADRQSEHTESCVQLLPKFCWRNAISHFENCRCHELSSVQCSAIVGELPSRPPRREKSGVSIRRHRIFETHEKGAIIFGHMTSKLHKREVTAENSLSTETSVLERTASASMSPARSEPAESTTSGSRLTSSHSDNGSLSSAEGPSNTTGPTRIDRRSVNGSSSHEGPAESGSTVARRHKSKQRATSPGPSTQGRPWARSSPSEESTYPLGIRGGKQSITSADSGWDSMKAWKAFDASAMQLNRGNPTLLAGSQGCDSGSDNESMECVLGDRENNGTSDNDSLDCVPSDG
jgi:hypothetical protein